MKKYIVILVFCLTTILVEGQSTELFFTYQPAYIFGENSSFSPRGVDFEANRFLSEDLSIGFVVGWNIFTKKVVGESLIVNGALVTGTQVKYQNFVPLNVNLKKYFSNGGDLTPYVGAGLGTSFSEKRTDIGIFTLSDKKWLFNVAPEVGLLYDVSYSTVLSLKLKYNYSAKAGDFPSVSYLSFGLGIGIN